jgi:2-amino-4-hydroxy-6-hydroxymethyldihydropteridine diphosphokinase
MPHCFISLGGNLRAVEESFDQALEILAATPSIQVIARSGIHQTVAVGDDAGGEFLNAAAEIVTELPPLDLLSQLHAVEDELGRTREHHWGPRTIDLDLLLYGSTIVEHPRLRVPHPACWYRRFVLDPLVEIARDVVHPERGLTIGEFSERLRDRPLRLAMAGRSEGVRIGLMGEVSSDHPHVEIEQWNVDADASTLVAWLGPEEAEESHISLDDLPRAIRLDLSNENDPATALRFIVESMIGE